MPYFQYESFRMHYEVVRGVVPADTLLIHGNVASNLWWQPSIEVWDSLKKREENPERPWTGSLILAEWRGCGKSSGPSCESDMDFTVLANDYVELLESLGVSRANVIGHSAGGMIALHAMMQKPESFGRAVLLNSVPAHGINVTPEMQAAYLQMARNRELVKVALARAVDHSETSPLFEKLVDQACATHPLVWAHILQKLAGVDVGAWLVGLKNPTLVLHGEQDPILPVAGSRQLAELLPEGSFQPLELQGHSCNIENPERFVSIAHRFLFG